MIDPKKYVKVVSKQQATPVSAGNYVNILNQDITVTENGVYTAEAGYTGLGTVTVNVPTEATGSVTFTENGTYNIAQYASVTVAVPMNTTSLSVTENGTYTPGGSNIGFSSVSVAVPNRTTSTTINYNGTYYPDSPYIGFDSVTVSIHTEALNITPTTSAQEYYATDEVAGYAPVHVAAVTSAIDANITPSNIRNGVTILGVTGNASVAPAKFIERKLTSSTLSVDDVSSYINLSGIETVGDYALGFAFVHSGSGQGPAAIPDLSSIKTIRGRGCYYTFAGCASSGSVDLSSLNFVLPNGCFCMFYSCPNITSVYLGNTNTTVDDYGMRYMFANCTNLSTVIMKINTIWAASCEYMFSGCTHLTTCEFDTLEQIKGSNALSYAFNGCTSLMTLYFPALTTLGGGTTQFNNMLLGCSNVTVHFPSNFQSIIGSWVSVTNGFGGTNTTVLFDLPATNS